MVKKFSLKTKAWSRSSVPTSPMQDESYSFQKKRVASLKINRNKMSMQLDTIHHRKHPLFASIGDGLANWFGNENESTQSLEFLTWTDDFV